MDKIILNFDFIEEFNSSINIDNWEEFLFNKLDENFYAKYFLFDYDSNSVKIAKFKPSKDLQTLLKFLYDNINTIFTDTTVLDMGDMRIKFEEGVSNGVSILSILDDLNFRMIEYNSIKNVCNTTFIHNIKDPIYKSIIKSLEYYQSKTL